jgi:hypothetical protein
MSAEARCASRSWPGTSAAVWSMRAVPRDSRSTKAMEERQEAVDVTGVETFQQPAWLKPEEMQGVNAA